MSAIRIVLADDHEIVRNGIKALLESEEDLQVIGEAVDGKDALEKIQILQPDLLIIDIRMPNLDGLSATRQVKNYAPNTKTLVLSMHHDEAYVLQAIENGASGYLLKDTGRDEFVKAIKRIHGGEKYFSGMLSNILIKNLQSGGNSSSPVDTMTSTASVDTQSIIANYDITKREKQILSLLVSGATNKEIAQQLSKSVRTIETHRFNIMKKLKVNNIVELLRKVDDEPALKTMIHS